MKISSKDIIGCLPLLANILGNKYGVKIEIGGDEAKTDGKVIYLPALPAELDRDTLDLVKGYLDHEAAHVRHTDFDILRHSQLDAAALWLFNAIEDWRVENRLAAIYPGCKDNFRRLIQKVFVEDKPEEAGNKNPAFLILNYVLLTVRAWDEVSLTSRLTETRKKLDENFPGLSVKMEEILSRVREDCPNTNRAIAYALELEDCVKSWGHAKEPRSVTPRIDERSAGRGKRETRVNESPANGEKGSEKMDNEEKNRDKTAQKNQSAEKQEAPKQFLIERINNLLEENNPEIPPNLGDILKRNIEGLKTYAHEEGVVVASVTSLKLDRLPMAEKREAGAICNAMRQKLCGLLQTKTMRQSATGRKGKLRSNYLYRLTVGNGKVFRRENWQTGLSTAVHILLDCSSSMSGESITLARKICYSVAKTLEAMNGVNPAITVFPANPESATVSPLIKHGGKVSDRLAIDACGSTPLAPALWWTLLNMLPLKEERKIILLLTDGVPDSIPSTRVALKKCHDLGFEVYGLGIKCRAIESLLPDTGKVIWNLDELAPAMFGLLKAALFKESKK